MGKKDKDKKKNSSQEKFEKKYTELEDELKKTRKKLQKLLKKNAVMEVNDYVLKDKDGNDKKLSEMFGDKSDLIVVHNMGKSCSYCTLWADGFSGVKYFIEKKTAFVVVSPDAPEVQKAFAAERGWKFDMYSGKDSTFIKDMGYLTDAGSYWPGASVFHKDSDGKIHRVTKTFFGPGDDYCSVWHFFDLLPESQENSK
jgi:predicted dithiol-disulfide oxidoreductase (DUF899 family)